MVKKFPADYDNLAPCLEYIEQGIRSFGKLKSREIHEAMLTVEECLVKLLHNSVMHGEVRVSIRKLFGAVTVSLESVGQIVQFSDRDNLNFEFDIGDCSRDTEAAIREIIISSYADHIKYQYKNGCSHVTIHVGSPSFYSAILNISVMAVAVVLGLLFYWLMPQASMSWLDNYLLNPVKTMFLNALSFVVEPVVFFTVAVCSARVAEFVDPGRIGKKVLLLYAITSVVSVLLGITLGAYVPELIDKNSFGMLGETVSDFPSVSKGGLISTIINIVPSNIVEPFMKGNTLQVIVLAIICGVAIGATNKVSALRSFFEAGKSLVLKITDIVMLFAPIAVFCATVSLVFNLGPTVIVEMLHILGIVVFGFVCMIVLYCAFLAIAAKLNPFVFFKKFLPTAVENFSLGSSTAAIPNTMRACRRNLGISQTISSFSIPIGAQFNMDGSNIYLAVSAVVIANLCGVAFGDISIVSLCFVILVLTIGSANIPGSNLVCLSMLISQMGVSADALAIVMGIDAILSMFSTAANTFGDVVISTIVAKRESLLDSEVFYASKRELSTATK